MHRLLRLLAPRLGPAARLVVLVLRFALDAMDVKPKDFREMEAQGLTPDDVREMIGFAAFCVFNTIFTTLANTALRDE